jgi:hypothetical protein
VARPDRYWLRGLTLTLGLYVLVSVAITGGFGLFLLVMLAALALSVTLFYWMFPGSHFTTIALANFLSIYACLFAFFVETNFATAGPWAVRLSFLLPIVAFDLGVALRHVQIRLLVTTKPKAGYTTRRDSSSGWCRSSPSALSASSFRTAISSRSPSACCCWPAWG